MATEAWLAAVELTSQGHQRHDVGHLGEARTEAVGPPAVERRSVEFLGELAKQAVDEREARVAVLSSRWVHHGEQKLRLFMSCPLTRPSDGRLSSSPVPGAVRLRAPP